MRAVTFIDGQVVVDDRPTPEPGRGELLVAVRAAGLNRGDLLQQAGLYPAPAGSPPDIPGLEAAGEVIAVGDGVSAFAVGDRVMAVVGGGAQADRLVVHERHAIGVPDGVSWAAAGAFPEVFTTAHDALFTQARLSTGEHLCVHGAAGGVGTAAIQLAVAAGARVTATVRNEASWPAVAAFGATVVAPAGFGEHGPFDVILELVGGPNLDDDVRSLAVGGRISVIGVGAGAKASINLLSLMTVRGSIMASTLRARPLEGKAVAAQAVQRHVVPLLASQQISVPVAATYPLEQAEAAYAHLGAGGTIGKVVLTID